MTLTQEQQETLDQVFQSMRDAIAELERYLAPSGGTTIDAHPFVVVRQSVGGALCGLRMIEREPFTFNFAGQTPGNTSQWGALDAKSIVDMLNREHRLYVNGERYRIIGKYDFFQNQLSALKGAMEYVETWKAEQTEDAV